MTQVKDNVFSKWTKWDERDSLKGIRFSGVYCLAISEKNLSGQVFEWIPEIAYIGMTNSKAGLKGRLKQFDNTIIGKTGHGGGARFRFKYRNYQDLVKNLYVSICSFECNVESNDPLDLRVMGEVARFEYECFAEYSQRFKKLPEFNDKKRSPKYLNK